MNTLCAALDSQTSTPYRNQGEKGHTQYNWISPNSNAEEAFVQLYFQMVRAKSVDDSKIFRDKMRDIITECYAHNTVSVAKYLFKLIGHTRDIIDGKGERTLSYAGIMEWYNVNPTLSQRLFDSFVHSLDSNGEKTDGHQYGSWNDVKYFSNYVRELTGNRNHPMIEYAITSMSNQVRQDIQSYHDGKSVSLAIRHMPKQGNANGWLYRKIALNIYPYHETARTTESRNGAIAKAERQLRKVYTNINRSTLKTPQVFMASGAKGEGEWDKLEFGKMTSKTIRAYPKAFQNLTKKGETRCLEEHRLNCADNYRSHMDSVSRGEAKVNGKRCNPYELVKDVFNLGGARNKTEESRINGQWVDKMTTARQLGNFIPIVDVSGSMTCDEGLPLYSAIGLGIRLSETSVFKDRILTFHNEPSWVKLQPDDTFCDKVRKIQHAPWGMTTNFYKAMDLILDTIVDNNIPPSEVSNMVLAVFSDMQIDQGSLTGDTDSDVPVSRIMYQKYHDAGMRSQYREPYTPPHILWWNLRTTSGFPEISSTKNTTMLSGFSDALLNSFFEKGVDALNDFTPKKMIYDILDKERYAPLEHLFY
jgi:hypothetical protein